MATFYVTCTVGNLLPATLLLATRCLVYDSLCSILYIDNAWLHALLQLDHLIAGVHAASRLQDMIYSYMHGM